MMTREEVIRLANWLERFAQLVAAAERERCAKVCDRKKKEFAEAFKDMADESLGAGQCAAAIRAMEDQ